MKKIRSLMILIILSFSCLGMAACTKTETPPIDSKDITTPLVPEDKNDTFDVNIIYTSTTLENGNVEDTVAAIYDSVVAIDSYLNGSLYGSGSGVLFGSSEGLSFLVTCHHVIENCTAFKVILSNGESLDGKLVGGDAENDIAVLSVEKTGLCYASWFENTDTLRLGSSVICIGNPLGTLPGSVATGVISYNNRSVAIDSYHNMDLIQTDVAINSGNSGGGLFNSAGALIGVVNGKYSSSGIEGLGFAIPAKTALRIVDSILKTASYQKETGSWETGYVVGRWNLGFSLGYGGYGFIRSTIGIAGAATNTTSSDYNKLLVNDLLNSITIEYASSEKESKSLTNITAQTTIEAVYKFIYSADLTLGDTLIFEITRNNERMQVEVPLIQYRYSI